MYYRLAGKKQASILSDPNLKGTSLMDLDVSNDEMNYVTSELK